MSPEGAFTAGDVIKMTGATRIQLNHWLRVQVIRPSVRQSSGAGDVSLFNDEDVLAIRAAVLLAAFRIPAPVIKATIGRPFRDAVAAGDRFLVLFDSRGHHIMRGGVKDLTTALTHQDAAVVLDVHRIRRVLELGRPPQLGRP